MKVYIYVLKHPVTNEIRYVGLTRFPVKRLNNEINYPHTKHLRNWVASLKTESLLPVMEVVEETEEELACEAEKRWIAEKRAQGCRLINFTDGGERGYKITDEYRAALSAGIRGKKRRPMSDEHKAKISAANKGRQFNPNSGINFTVLNRSRAGIPLSKETKAKLSLIGKDKMHGERLKKLMEGGKKFKRPSKWTDEQKSEVKFLIAEGYSMKVIADAYGTNVGMISAVKRGRAWSDALPATHDFLLPAAKSIAIYRNEKGQYERVA
jgi:hypothetical protein